MDTPSLSQALRDAAPAARPAPCKSSDAASIVVCGRTGERYRIDPAVLAAQRAAEALPVKPPVTAESVSSDCVGPQHCGGGTIPLVGMALAALKAVELASHGDDWRDAFRMHPDEYQAYQEAQTKGQRRARISSGVTASK